MYTIFFLLLNAVKHTTHIIYTPSWLYQDDSQIRQALDNEENVALRLCPDHCKLIADIALQLPLEECDNLLESLPLSNAERSSLELGEKNFEDTYKGLIMWISSRRQPNLDELKSTLEKIGYDIQLCHSSIPVLSDKPWLNNKICDQYLCTRLASKIGKQWKFLGRYLGLTNVDIDDLLSIVEREGKVEAVFQMLYKWLQQYGRTATVDTLAKSVYRIHQLNSQHMNEAWWFIQQEIADEFSLENMDV